MSLIFMILVNAYAMTVFWLLLDVKAKAVSRRNFTLFLAFLAVTAVNTVLFTRLLDGREYGLWYPVIVQLPSVIAFSFVSPYKGIKLLFVFLTAVFLTSPLVMATLALGLFPGVPAWGYLAATLASIALMVLFVVRVFKPMLVYLLEHESKGFGLFCLIPFISYAVYYLISGYDLVSKNRHDLLVFRIALTACTLVAYFMSLTIHRRTRELGIAENDLRLLGLRASYSERHVEEMMAEQERTKMYRHDMRHHFALVASYLDSGDVAAARKHVSDAESALDGLSVREFCEHRAANLILGAYAERARRSSVRMTVDADIPADMGIPDLELCGLLSNALENAVNGCESSGSPDPGISVNCAVRDGKFFVRVENTAPAEIPFSRGIPVGRGEGHGYGTKSMIDTVESRGGVWDFSLRDGVFSFSSFMAL